jgi:2,3-diketo-5-methylthiopentyl-1-phosphate enolase
MNLNEHVFAYPETTAQADYLIATYFIQLDAREDVLAKAAGLAIGQTIGTWTEVPGLTSEMIEKHMGRVVGIMDVPPIEISSDLQSDKRNFVIQISFPEINFGAQLPLLLTTILGNDVSTSARVKLLDIHISKSLASQFKGPRFGIAGIRQLCGVHDRPLILNVMKPCTGFPPESAVPWFEESARAGSDIIKDDELLANASFNQISQRVKLFHETAKRVYEETGHRALYCANITDRPDRMMENARKAVELGADLLMLASVPSGLGSLQALAEMEDCNVPILAHFAGFSTMTESPTSGLSSPLLLGKLNRLAGADAISFPCPYSAYPLMREKFIRTAQFMRMPLYDVKASMPVPGGGIHPATAVRIANDLGKDILLTVGGAIQGHPQGATAGVQALHAALDAWRDKIPLEKKAAEVPALQVALDAWDKK